MLTTARTPREILHTDSGVSVTIEDITPYRAAEYLQRNDRNRKLGKEQVAFLARVIRSGKWGLNGATIVFGRDGRLLDGQHRLQACVNTGINIVSLVVRGIEPGLQVDMDQVRKRSRANALQMEEIPAATALSAIANRVMMSRAAKRIVGATGGSRYPRYLPSEVLDFVRENFDAIHHSHLVTQRARYNRVPASLSGSCHWFFTEASSPEDADAFFRLLATGEGLERGNPILALRERLIKNSTATTTLPIETVAAFYVKTWNAWIQGVDLYALRFSPGGGRPEEFPKLYGHPLV